MEFDKEFWWDEDGGDTSDDRLRYVRAQALAHLPLEDAEAIAEGCIFLIERQPSASYVSAHKVRGRAVLLFSPESLDEDDAVETCLHEMAHFILKHKDPIEAQGSLEVFENQEREAWERVGEWLNREPEWAEAQFVKHNPPLG